MPAAGSHEESGGSQAAAAEAARAAGADLFEHFEGHAESEARAQPQAGRRNSHQRAGCMAVAIADAWSLSLQQVGTSIHSAAHA